jgi:hypothetical protein
MHAEVSANRLKSQYLIIAMAVTKWGELAVVPSLKVPMNNELETEGSVYPPTARCGGK